MLQRAILKQLAIVLVCLTFLMGSIVWLTQSLRFIEVIVHYKFPLTTFIKLIGYLIPDLAIVILPIALFVAVIFILQKLINDNELLIMQSIGLDNYKISRPFIGLSLIVMGLIFITNIYFLPLSFRKFRELELHIRNNPSLMLLQEGDFNTFKTMTVYIRKNLGSTLEGILIFDNSQPDQPVTIAADQGYIENHQNSLKLKLIHGYRQTFSKKDQKISTLFFDEYTSDFNTPPSENARTLKPSERFLPQLFFPDDLELSPAYKNKLKSEGYQRLLSPLYAVAFTLIALAFLLHRSWFRENLFKPILLSSATVITIQILSITFLHLSADHTGFVMLAYSLIIGSILLAYRKIVR